MKQIKIKFSETIPIQLNETISIDLSLGTTIVTLTEQFVVTRTQSGEINIGTNANENAFNYKLFFENDYINLSNNNIVLTVVDNVVLFVINSDVLEFTNVAGTAISNGSVVFEYGSSNLKYWLEFTDIKNILHRIDFFNEDYLGFSNQIFGSSSLDYSETKDTLEPIRGSGLKIDLEARSDLTFEDLYSEEERTFSVVYTRGGEALFNGWLSPEGLYQSYVEDNWIISLDCTDGLGFLKNLSYVEDATGLTFGGKQSALEIIVNCLKRTKTPQDILTDIDIFYNGLNETLDPLVNVYFNANRFIKDDKDTIMNCDEVLKSVLEIFGAVITSYKGKWVIYKPNKLVDTSLLSFFCYDSEGVVKVNTDIEFGFNLGSQINDFYPHHVNANQQISTISSIGAYRINYKYGLVKNLLDNPYLSVTGGTVDNYTITTPTSISVNASNGFVITRSFSTPIDVIESDIFTIPISTKLKISMDRITSTVYNVLGNYKLILTNGTETYYYNGNDWGTVSSSFGLSLSFDTIETSATPIEGDVKFIIMTNKGTYRDPDNGNVIVSDFISMEYVSILISPNNDLSNLEGENHNFQRTLKPSSKIADVKKVFNGDNPSDIYLGTIYKSDQTTPTEVDGWSRLGLLENKNILEIMGEERMKMYAKPTLQFDGDVFGFFNYLSLVNIDNFTNKFAITAYSYDCLNNVVKATFTEILNTDLTDLEYKLSFDYGNVVEPTIKG